MIGRGIINSAADSEEKLALAKAIDKANIALKSYRPEFSSFMDPYRAHKFKSLLSPDRSLKITLYGGFDMAERLKLGFFSEYDNSEDFSLFPISAVEVLYNGNFVSGLTHRDFLGSVMGLGITRDKVGDIITEESRAVVFCDDDIAEYICTNLERVKHTKVKCSVLDGYKPKPKQMTEKKFTVASLRLDAVLAHAFNMARGKTSDFIKSEKAFVNWRVETSVSKTVSEGDIITLRGYGRIKILEIMGTTKRDRILLNIGIYK